MKVSVIGATGFVGRAVAVHLQRSGHEVIAVKAPRISAPRQAANRWWAIDAETVGHLAEDFKSADTVVCAAGISDASSQDLLGLYGANTALPVAAAAAARRAGVSRFVHISSAVVQGSKEQLDSSLEHRVSSPYGESKAQAEQALLSAPHPMSTVIYRPPSVHSPERRVTRAIYRIANSPASCVMDPTAPTPQAHIDNVAHAIAFLATCTQEPPQIVIHPWEGWKTFTFLELFGQGKTPEVLPRALRPAARSALHALMRANRLAPNARRIEMLWFGQRQAPSWLTAAGCQMPVGKEGWRQMVAEVGAIVDSENTRT